MKTKSAKAKGRKLQDLTRDRLMQVLELSKSEIRCAIMGEKGRDIIFSDPAKYPYFFECKNCESISVFKEFQYTKDRAGEGFHPVLVIKRNRVKKPLVVVELDFIANLIYYYTIAVEGNIP